MPFSVKVQPITGKKKTKALDFLADYRKPENIGRF
tara:strand:- start:299 stop:403 length:105 start_codon:yes stop_codon:yes gene_type:complete